VLGIIYSSTLKKKKRKRVSLRGHQALTTKEKQSTAVSPLRRWGVFIDSCPDTSKGKKGGGGSEERLKSPFEEGQSP